MCCEYWGSVNTVLLKSTVAAIAINWQICCLCQLDTHEFLQTPRKEGVISLEKDFTEYISIKGTLPSGVTVNLNDLNDGSDIISTLEANQAKYHKKCRSFYSSSRLKRLREKTEKEVPCCLSPKNWGHVKTSRQTVLHNVSAVRGMTNQTLTKYRQVQ